MFPARTPRGRRPWAAPRITQAGDLCQQRSLARPNRNTGTGSAQELEGLSSVQRAIPPPPGHPPARAIPCFSRMPPFVPPPLGENAGTDDSVPRRPPSPAKASGPAAPRGRSRLSPSVFASGANTRLSHVRIARHPAPRRAIPCFSRMPPLVPARLRENAGTDDSVPRRPPSPAKASSPAAPRGRSRLSPSVFASGANTRLSHVRIARRSAPRRAVPQAVASPPFPHCSDGSDLIWYKSYTTL